MNGHIEVKCLLPNKTLPLLVQAIDKNISLIPWVNKNHESIETHVLKHGGILFRDFRIDGVAGFENLIKATSGDLMDYQDRGTPRTLVSGNIYTATDHPPDHEIFLHNESSFAYTWPSRIFFYCLTKPQKGGETPIADVRKVFHRINPEIREHFIRRKIMYVRNFGNSLFGLTWQTVFQTENRSEMESYCRKTGIDFEWIGKERLRTRQIRPAMARHPKSGEKVWFNHAAVFHVTTLPQKTREMLLRMLRYEDLPNNTYYGDGSEIELSVIDELREAYERETVIFNWQEGDVLMLDNMLVAHGRRPYVGQRRVVVGMAIPTSWEDVSS